MTVGRLLVGCGIFILALWGASLAVERGVSAVPPPADRLVAVAAMPVPTLTPLRPLRLPKRDIFAADVQPPVRFPSTANAQGVKGIGSYIVPDVTGASGSASALTVLATGIDLDTNAGYALIEDGDGGRIVHAGDPIGANGLTVVSIGPRVITLSDGTVVSMQRASSRAGSGPTSQVPLGPQSTGAQGGGYFGPSASQAGAPVPAGVPSAPGVPLNGTVNSITVLPGLNVGTNPGGFSSPTGIPSGTAPQSLSGALSGALGTSLPGAATTGLGTGNAYQGMDPFSAPNTSATPGVVNPGAVR